jgi:hypothetical protein
MQPYNPKAPSRSDALIDELRHTAGSLINGDVEDGSVPVALLAGAADEIERLRRIEFRLARRIHEQRRNLRMNWAVMASHAAYRRGWRQNPLLIHFLKTRKRPTPWWRRWW